MRGSGSGASGVASKVRPSMPKSEPRKTTRRMPSLRSRPRKLVPQAATLGAAMRHVAFLNVPSAVGLAVLARPIISMIYEHGRFQPEDTAATAQALVYYALGLYAYSGVKVFAPAFYALDDARVPGDLALINWPTQDYRSRSLLEAPPLEQARPVGRRPA